MNNDSAVMHENKNFMNLVVMGVAGCGKSIVGAKIASILEIPLVEGDFFHPQSNLEKMKAGIPLTDDDRSGWLQRLCEEMAALSSSGAILTCSALKRSYRQVLRQAIPNLRFVYLKIDLETAKLRVAQRTNHFYPTSLVDSQFESLEDPSLESGVLQCDAMLAPDYLATTITERLYAERK